MPQWRVPVSGTVIVTGMSVHAATLNAVDLIVSQVQANNSMIGRPVCKADCDERLPAENAELPVWRFDIGSSVEVWADTAEEARENAIMYIVEEAYINDELLSKPACIAFPDRVIEEWA